MKVRRAQKKLDRSFTISRDNSVQTFWFQSREARETFNGLQQGLLDFFNFAERVGWVIESYALAHEFDTGEEFLKVLEGHLDNSHCNYLWESTICTGEL